MVHETKRFSPEAFGVQSKRFLGRLGVFIDVVYT